MSTAPVRWNLLVSPLVDASVREFLAAEGQTRESELSRFVEEAVRERIFDLTAKAIKEQNAGRSADEIDEIVEEALLWARRQ
jgi:hypothetical protein